MKERMKECKNEKQTDKQTDRQTDRQKDRMVSPAKKILKTWERKDVEEGDKDILMTSGLWASVVVMTIGTDGATWVATALSAILPIKSQICLLLH